MRTHVTVRSAAFPAYPGEEDQINPGRFGKRLAEFVRDSLTEAGLPAGEPFAEDWGWGVGVANPAFPLWVGCGNVDGETTEFLCFVVPSKPSVRRGLRRVSTVDRVEAVAAVLSEAFAAHPDVEFEWEPDRA